jgi:hypothetical protein
MECQTYSVCFKNVYSETGRYESKVLLKHEKRCLTVPRAPSNDNAITNAATYSARELSQPASVPGAN